MNRNIILIFLVFFLFACTSKQEKDSTILNEQEKYDFINSIYQDELNRGNVFLYEEPIISTFPKLSILVLNNIIFRQEKDTINRIHEIWKEELLDKRFLLIKTSGKYENDTLFKNSLMLSISQPIQDISGKFILITEEEFNCGYIVDRNTYIYTKDSKNDWKIHYRLNIGKEYDE